MPTQCCAMGCRNRGHHLFPKDTELRNQWEIAVGRNNFTAKKHTSLCPDHFKDEDYIKEGFASGMKLARKILKKGAIPSRFDWNDKVIIKDEKLLQKYEMHVQREEKLIKTEILEDSKENFMCEDPLKIIKIEITEDTTDMSVNPIDEIKTECSVTCDTNSAVEMKDVASKVKVSDAATSTSLDSSNLPSRSISHVGTQKNYQFFCIGTFMKNNKALNFYTGFKSYEKFQFVLSTLCPEAHSIKYNKSQVLLLSLEDQFLLTSIKLRRNHLDFELAMLFDISQGTVSNIIISWLNFMHQKWSVSMDKSRKDLMETYIPEECTYPTTVMAAEKASGDSCASSQQILAVKGVTRLKGTLKTFHFLKMQKCKKYMALMIKARFVCQILGSFMEGKV